MHVACYRDPPPRRSPIDNRLENTMSANFYGSPFHPRRRRITARRPGPGYDCRRARGEHRGPRAGDRGYSPRRSAPPDAGERDPTTTPIAPAPAASPVARAATAHRRSSRPSESSLASGTATVSQRVEPTWRDSRLNRKPSRQARAVYSRTRFRPQPRRRPRSSTAITVDVPRAKRRGSAAAQAVPARKPH